MEKLVTTVVGPGPDPVEIYTYQEGGVVVAHVPSGRERPHHRILVGLGGSEPRVDHRARKMAELDFPNGDVTIWVAATGELLYIEAEVYPREG